MELGVMGWVDEECTTREVGRLLRDRYGLELEPEMYYFEWPSWRPDKRGNEPPMPWPAGWMWWDGPTLKEAVDFLISEGWPFGRPDWHKSSIYYDDDRYPMGLTRWVRLDSAILHLLRHETEPYYRLRVKELTLPVEGYKPLPAEEVAIALIRDHIRHADNRQTHLCGDIHLAVKALGGRESLLVTAETATR